MGKEFLKITYTTFKGYANNKKNNNEFITYSWYE